MIYTVFSHALSNEHVRSIFDFDNLPSSRSESNTSANHSADKKSGAGSTAAHIDSSTPDLSASRQTIYGSDTVSAPSDGYSYMEREQRADAYAHRVTTQLENINSHRKGERSFKFQNARMFMEPSGYFSGALLAAGLDPHKKITVTFNAYVGMGHAAHLTRTESHTYSAWEIAAGALAHDKPARGGVVNFNSMVINPEDKSTVNDLEALGKKLQHHWEQDIAPRMRNASGTLAKMSGESDAYVLKGTLQNLIDDQQNFQNLSPEGQAAVKRTLNESGQVIIPNIYGYPLAGYAFIPYTPYDGDYNNHRPNKGVMVDLKNGGVSEINGDRAFSSWAKDNRDNVLRSFNARDRQGGKDAHWPRAGDVLSSLISGGGSYPGRHNFLSDEAVPVLETFNYARSRDSDYELKYGTLNNGIEAKFQAVNAKNATWAAQTEVFGSSQHNWKYAKDLWGNTFGYLPIVGNVGSLVFGVHDAIDGMTAEDRVGGSAAAVISALQLVHEVGPQLVEGTLGEPAIAFNPGGHYRWRYDAQKKNFDLIRASNASKTMGEVPVNGPATTIVKATPEAPATLGGMKEIQFEGKQYFVSQTPDAGDGEHFLLRVRDPKDPEKWVSSGKIAKPDKSGVWKRRGVVGGQQTEPVLIKERIAGSTLQKSATPDQIFELNELSDGRYALTSQDPRYGKFVLRDGAYAFVIRAEEPDKIYVGSMDKGRTPDGKYYRYNAHVSPQFVEGHSALTQGLQTMKGGTTDVRFAGTIYVEGGKPKFWTNESGHYQPPAQLRETNLTPAVKKILPEEKFVEEDNFTREQRKDWLDAIRLTKEEMEARDEFMQQKYATNDSGNEISDSDDD
ncbi:hypothetical protein [Pseudomonas sp. 18175]|uniref:hypothetical protein n=1 Tax=Pseudomonas sp. 18175 TaxID=3390056 RepID=UPI003D218F10